jgi:ribosomal protein L9
VKVTTSDPILIFTLADKLAESEIDLLKSKLNETYQAWLEVAATNIVDKLSKEDLDADKDAIRLVVKKEILPEHAEKLLRKVGIISWKNV